MKTRHQLTLAFVVLLALAVLSAPVLANPAAIAYGASVPIVERELKELTPQAAMPGDVSVFTQRAEPVGFRAADNLRVTVFHSLALKFSATVLNLPNEKTHKVWFGFPGSIDMDAYASWSDRTDIKRKLQEARKADLGQWYLGFPVGGNRWECYVPSDILNVNQTTQVVVKLEGQFNKSKIKILWLITIKSWQGGRYEERIEVACVEAPQGAETMPREVLFAHLMGFAPAWAAQVMSQPPGMGGPMGQTTAPSGDYVTPQELGLAFNNFRTTIKDDVRAVVREELSTTTRSAPTPTRDAQGVSASGGESAPTELLAIRPDGGYQVLDRENDDRWVISRGQKVYVYFNRPLQEGERFEYGMTYVDANDQTQWTHDAEGNPFPVPASEVIGDHFFLRFNNRASVAAGEHTLFVRVVSQDGELASVQKTLVIREDDIR